MTITLPLVIDILLALLLTVGVVALVYLTMLLVRANAILRRVDQVVGYAARVQGIIESWEALPRQIFSWAMDILPQFLPSKQSRSRK